MERVAAPTDEFGGGDSEVVCLFCQEGLSLADGRATAQAVEQGGLKRRARGSTAS